MLHFRGSDYKRSQGSTWYNRMDSLLVTPGFTESKEDSNLFLKVEGGRPMMLMLYVNDLFLTEVARRRLAAKFKLKDLDMMHYFLGIEVWQNLPGTREVCSRDPGKVQDDGLQGHDHTYGTKPEAMVCWFIIVGLMPRSIVR